MTDTSEAAAPPLTVHAQYIKDLSFENPRSPHSLMEQGQPQLGLNVLVKTRQLDGSTYEVALVVEADAKMENGDVLFKLELVYGGVFTLGAVPQEAVGPMLLIECPRLLFPFARAVVANTTREAGFPPLQVAPVDFAALYRQQLENAGAGDPPIGTA
ncbi:MAG: protein-export chaperone SecB [Rhodospirillales bacterium]|nr:protein-export chaperone SecB [Rhodospirillales bacterium]QQS10663.1 MAG: protein-export chaperone SecB [Rhodospirillales bacterium]